MMWSWKGLLLGWFRGVPNTYKKCFLGPKSLSPAWVNKPFMSFR